jgi:hydrogenase maturation factor HypF (carbamoyltransferase family)
MQTQVRRRIDVSGIVQGVGFRPYVYRLATSRHLSGTILNTAAGVTIEIQGSAEVVEDFLLRLSAEAPPLAKIEDLVVCARDTADQYRNYPSSRPRSLSVETREPNHASASSPAGFQGLSAISPAGTR